MSGKLWTEVCVLCNTLCCLKTAAKYSTCLKTMISQPIILFIWSTRTIRKPNNPHSDNPESAVCIFTQNEINLLRVCDSA